MSRWTNLTRRYGDSVPNPTEAQMREAIREVLATQDEEHPDAWIECGSDDGPLHTLTVTFGGHNRYTKYSDADMTDELETSEQTGLTEDEVLQAWKTLVAAEGAGLPSATPPARGPWWKRILGG